MKTSSLLIMTEAKKAEPQFREKEFFEYHIYSLHRPATIKENQTKQIRLVTAHAIRIK